MWRICRESILSDVSFKLKIHVKKSKTNVNILGFRLILGNEMLLRESFNLRSVVVSWISDVTKRCFIFKIGSEICVTIIDNSPHLRINAKAKKKDIKNKLYSLDSI